MTWDIALILSVDGLAGAAIYLLAGLGLVLVFSVTRVIFVPFGDIAVFSALTLAYLEAQRFPPTIGLVAVLAGLTVAKEVVTLIRRGQFRELPRAVLGWGILPMVPCLPAFLLAGRELPALVAIGLALILVVPIVPLLARLVFHPISHASTLVLLIAALVLHFLLSGLGLLFFGPEGFRTQPFLNGMVELLPGFRVSLQVLLMVGTSLALAALFFLAFERTLVGKALRATAVNRVGAQLVGIRPATTATLTYTVVSLLAGFVGILIAPSTTMYYDSGLIIGLKAFVAAIIGGLSSYPLTALGAIAVGMLESFASFWNGAMKDVIVFSLLIPALLVRSHFSNHSDDGSDEEEV
ncbi:amino acid/amide ABC transporter membrane protein 1, HAAT family [Salinihabitans flavidus]|uniref:Amino acid/amide ABC transporter membrane protein 1, HAAT family n=1 Tax=Salinihabitans flavidus TaxID=569882 RepID=A0A1H8ULY0_9RHOB|nr:branched-chain amino acid ABC transporter permease [Salinihabitans flavidus]SEP04230.1 amino acid/amide ABC transporter membrane protein 1, HAAT family [Salinihabitans flavidus]